MNTDKFFNLGVKIAALVANKTPVELAAIDGFVSAVDDNTNPNYGALQKLTCKFAADAFEEAGRKSDITYHVYDQLSKYATWYPALDTFSDAALKAIGKLSLECNKEAANNEKNEIAKQAKNLLPELISFGGESVPELVKNMASIGTLGGGLAGGLYWLLNRHSNEDEDKAEVIKAKINYYNKLSDEIKNQLQQNPNAESSDVKQIVEKNIF